MELTEPIAAAESRAMAPLIEELSIVLTSVSRAVAARTAEQHEATEGKGRVVTALALQTKVEVHVRVRPGAVRLTAFTANGCAALLRAEPLSVRAAKVQEYSHRVAAPPKTSYVLPTHTTRHTCDRGKRAV